MILFAAALPGSLYVFQGEEFGLPEVLDIPDDRREDPIFARTNRQEIGRDGCRIPLPWSNDSATAFGFSTVLVESWLPQPADWGRWSLEGQHDDSGSMFTLYHDVIARRRLIDQSTTLEWIDPDADEFIAYRRGSLIVLMNLSADALEVPAAMRANGGVMMVSSQAGHSDPRIVPANMCAWFDSV